MNISDILKNGKTHYAIGVVIGTAVSLGAEKVYEKIKNRGTVIVPSRADEEEIRRLMEEARVHRPIIIDAEVYEALRADDPPVEVVESEVVEEQPVEEVPEPVEEPALVNVFRNENDVWDYEEELKSRAYNHPYVIHQDEFTQNEVGHNQRQVNYYAVDNVMTDSLDEIIYDHNKLMGELKFGHGSNSSGVVYIRNEKMRMDWEVLLCTGSYEHEILGLQADHETEKELRHSQSSLRFRAD